MTEYQPITRAAPALAAPTRRQALIGAALLAAAAAGAALRPRHLEKLLGNAKLEDLVPKAFGGWSFQAASGLVLPPQDQLRDTIYNQLLTRVYTHPSGASVMLLVAYSGAQDGTIQIHRPEVCYPASGFRLVETEPHRVSVAAGVAVPSRYLIADSGLRREQIVYWTRQGGHFPTTWLEQKGAVIAENFAGIVPDGVLVRMSSTVAGRAPGMFDGFAHALYAAVGARMREVLVGTTLSALGDAR